MGRFAKRKLDVLSHIESREQRALLKQYTATPCSAAVPKRNLAAPLRQQPDQCSHQDRFAAAGCTDQTDDFASTHVERKMIDHRILSESDHEVTDADGDCLVGHGYIPIDAKNTANNPSSTITRKIDFTTEVVVCLPSDSALP